MNLKTLLLGSITAAGVMSGAAYAADLGVLSSLDVCDQLGVSGLTISSDTNCLKISGEVSYNFAYGVWNTDVTGGGALSFTSPAGAISWGYNYDDYDAWVLKSEVKAKLNFEASADSSFGPAKAVIKLLGDYVGGGIEAQDDDNGDLGNGVETEASFTVDEAYVSIGEGTVLMAGHKGSIFNMGDDEPLNWLGLFNAEAVNSGVNVGWNWDSKYNSIEITHDLGNGFSLAGGLEGLEYNGSAAGVLAYKGESVSAHVSVGVDDVLQNHSDEWMIHAGIATTLDSIKLVAAVAADANSNWNVLGSAQATFDMFTIAGSVEADDSDYTGAGASLTADVSEGVKLNFGGRWSNYGDYTSYEVAVGAEAQVAEDLTLSGAIGYVEEDEDNAFTTTFNYAWAKLAWAPGGGFTASLKGTVTNAMDDGGSSYGPGYKIETEFKKTFE